MSESDPTKPAKPQPRLGSYQLLNSLGSGGMSSVFKAVHVETGHVVAVKVLPRALAKNVTLLQRFLREAKSAEALEHPNIVSIYDRGVDQGRYYLVLEYVEGGDLHDRIRNGGPLGIPEATAVIRAVARGLQFAASRGLIHRDIKPANILMTDEGRVKIIDLGLALQAENEDERVTREGTTVGTVDYMSPEQARDSRATSEKSDMYSLGCTFYFLLTASPPFPGGDVADKLSRHCLKPPPDPRQVRPEIPPPLALLIQRMMAKRPENRFRDYDELIGELDAVPTGEEKLAEAPLFALIDDNEDEDGDDAPLPVPEAEPALFALIDEDDEPDSDASDLPRLGVPGLLVPEEPEAPRKSRDRDVTPSLAEVSLAELASLSDEPPALSPPRRVPSSTRREAPEPVGPLAEALLDDDADDEAGGSVLALGPRRSYESTKKLVLTYVLVGMGLVLLVIGSHQLIRLTTTRPEPEPEVAQEEVEPELPPAPSVVEAAPVPKPAPRPAPVLVTRPKVADEKPVPIVAAPTVWVEPGDPVVPSLAGPDDDGPLDVGLLPDWARQRVPDRLGNRFVTVRRITDARDPAQTPSLRLALDVIGGTVEVADNGPFFEDDLRVFGETRLVRAREGFRPIVAIESPQLDVVRAQPAVVLLDGKNLILDGLDLVVNVLNLPAHQNALFDCRGGSLTLRGCTITILNPRGTPFSLVRTGPSTRPAKIRVERTLVRGASYTAFDLRSGSAEVVLNRSVLVAGRTPLISSRDAERGREARLTILRSLLCGRGPLVEVGTLAPGRNPEPVVLRSRSSTFANLAGEGTTSLILLLHEEDRLTDHLRWTGDLNVFAGWRDWASAGSARVVKVANLAAARATWPNTDLQSREDSSRWTITTDLERVLPVELGSFSPEAQAIAALVAAPTPYLFPKTVETFARMKVPALASPAEATSLPSVPPGRPAPRASSAATNGEPPRPEVRELMFDLQASPWKGDLGLFLRDQIKKEDTRIRVLVSGGGAHFCTPIRLPDGVSLEVRPNPANAPGLPPVTWSPQKGSDARALLEVRGGDLVLANVRLSRDGSSRPKHLVCVEHGHLVLSQCWLIGPGQVEKGAGALVEFRSPGSQPLPSRPSPFQTAAEFPIGLITDSLFITGGDAFRIELGRGVVVLSNCAAAAGENLFSLVPGKVARARFETGLWLDHCTLAAEKTFVNLGEWPGSAPGPDRPWLVTSKDTAFVSSYDRPSALRESVLLRVQGEALAHGTLFWQSVNDAYEVTHFTASNEAPPAANRRPDVQRQWVELWGEVHMHSTTGPIWSRGSSLSTPSVRFHDRLPSGRVSPADLELDPNYHPGRTRLSVGANLARLQVRTKSRSRR